MKRSVNMMTTRAGMDIKLRDILSFLSILLSLPFDDGFAAKIAFEHNRIIMVNLFQVFFLQGLTYIYSVVSLGFKGELKTSGNSDYFDNKEFKI
jgi:hypothetical protein